MATSTSVRRTAVSQIVSLVVHAVAFIALLGLPRFEIPKRSQSEYRQKISGKEEKIVWYKFKELPAVAPPKTKAAKRPPRAEAIAKQAIASTPKDAPKRDQMVWTPAPEMAPMPIESPNLLAVTLPPKQFNAPEAPAPPQVTQLQIPDAPVLEAKADLRVPALATRLPPKQFTPPTAKTSTGAPRSIEMANADNLNVAVVGLRPVERAAILPSLPSPGQFSAAPKLNPQGSEGDTTGKGITVPSLFVAGPKPAAAKPDLIAQAFLPTTSLENIRASARPAQVTNSPSLRSATPGAAKVSSAPDHHFDNREVYMMAIQMPNITSYSGSWLMWYSDHTLREQEPGAVSPPVPRRKVDPKYLPSAVADKVEGRVQLLCMIDREGRVSSIELVRGADERLNASAQEALAKWEFTPAMRNGAPIEVDVLVEIPFRLR